MDLPITKKQAQDAANWMKSNFKAHMEEAVSNTPFSVDLLCGIACQETAYFWLNLIDDHPVDEVLARCVLDASGDYPGTSRNAFPKNTEVFRERFGDDFTNMLIDEANQTRELRGFQPAKWVYKGYGIYQYDLQYVLVDEEFFREKKWCRYNECLDRLMSELKQKYNRHNDLWLAVKAYNGSGHRAEIYMENVKQFTQFCSDIS